MKVFMDKNGSLFDGNSCDVNGMVQCELNKDGRTYRAYNLDGTPDTKKIALLEAEERLVLEVMEARTYLNETDWYVVRFTETSKVIPVDVVTLRAAAREKLSELYETKVIKV